jgi:3-methyladenine DNA glycosylase AlkD
MPKPVDYIANHLREVLIDGASAPHTIEVENFFKQEISSRGWRAPELRALAKRFRKVIYRDAGLDYLVAVADNLFNGRVLEEKVLAVLLLEGLSTELQPKHFKTFESWLARISSWADHDALCNYIIGPLMVNEPRRTARALAWSRSADRWHRRAACVSLIRGVRLKRFELETEEVCKRLLQDEDDMVQKGLGWLLREAAKYNPDFAVPLLKSIRKTAPRLVLRTGCETLNSTLRTQILSH